MKSVNDANEDAACRDGITHSVAEISAIGATCLLRASGVGEPLLRSEATGAVLVCATRGLQGSQGGRWQPAVDGMVDAGVGKRDEPVSAASA